MFPVFKITGQRCGHVCLYENGLPHAADRVLRFSVQMGLRSFRLQSWVHKTFGFLIITGKLIVMYYAWSTTNARMRTTNMELEYNRIVFALRIHTNGQINDKHSAFAFKKLL